MQTQIRGLSTHYIDLPGTRGTVLFLHGWGAHIGLYQPIFDLLQQLVSPFLTCCSSWTTGWWPLICPAWVRPTSPPSR